MVGRGEGDDVHRDPVGGIIDSVENKTTALAKLSFFSLKDMILCSKCKRKCKLAGAKRMYHFIHCWLSLLSSVLFCLLFSTFHFSCAYKLRHAFSNLYLLSFSSFFLHGSLKTNFTIPRCAVLFSSVARFLCGWRQNVCSVWLTSRDHKSPNIWEAAHIICQAVMSGFSILWTLKIWLM